MTTRHLVRWLVPVVAIGVIGCGGSQPTQPATAAPAIVPPVTDDIQPANPAQPSPPAKPADPPVTLPSDTGGKAVAKALVVPLPLPPEAPTVKAPKPYSSAFDRGELPLPTIPPRPLSPSSIPTTTAAKPSPPAQGPLLSGFPGPLPEGKQSDRPLLKAPAPSNPRATDVPVMAWPRQERASLDDPTTDLSAVRVIETPLPIPAIQLPFLRAFIPNPFEFAEQLKGKLGKETELGTTPNK